MHMLRCTRFAYFCTMELKNLSLGILGGGQLGKMLIQAGSKWHLSFHVLDPTADCPAADIATTFTRGEFRDYQTVMDFAQDMAHLTIEIEDVNVEALEELQAMGKRVNPAPDKLRLIQDKGLQKQFFKEHHLPTSAFRLYADKAAVLKAVEMQELKRPFVQKLRKGGYDGRGVLVVREEADLEELFDAPCLVEDLVPIEKELAVIVARNRNGEVVSYPSVEMVFNPKANLVEMLACPADITEEQERQAEVTAIQVIKALELEGLLAVELFLQKNGAILVNELAPRPHNSGHHTIESCYTSQYEQHLRAISNLPLGSTHLHSPGVMVNLLGEPGHTGPARYAGFEDCLKMEGVYIHLYGKALTKPFRKMGHVTIIGRTLEEAKEKAKRVQKTLKVIT